MLIHISCQRNCKKPWCSHLCHDCTYGEDRLHNRKLIGGGAQIYRGLHPPLEEGEKRHGKGLYERARNGQLANFTGIDAPCEVPSKAESTIDTAKYPVAKCAEMIIE